MKFLAIAAVLITVYVGSYLQLSREGFAVADASGRTGFYFLKPRATFWWSASHSALRVLYWPLIQIDIACGTGRPVSPK